MAKFAENSRGYVLRSEVIGMAVSNERLERMIDRRAAMEDEVREEARREAVRKEMAKLDNPIKEEADLAEIEELARQRQENWMRGIMDIEGRSAGYREAMKEENKEYEEKRKELLKQWGGGEEEVEYIEAQSEFVDKTMKNFVADLKRMNNFFEDDKDVEGLAAGDDVVPEETYAPDKPLSKAAQARAEAMKNDGSGRPRLPGDADVTKGELSPDLETNESSSSTTGPLTVEVSSA